MKLWWDMEDLKQQTGRSQNWLKEHILLRPSYKQILDIDQGGFVHYPQSSGDKWCFIASRMSDFLEKHFAEIFAGRR